MAVPYPRPFPFFDEIVLIHGAPSHGGVAAAFVAAILACNGCKPESWARSRGRGGAARRVTPILIKLPVTVITRPGYRLARVG
jgi:hypothetical protein